MSSSSDSWLILARYNAEVARGLVHTEQWRAEMTILQAQFDDDERRRLLAEGFREVGNGAWVRTEESPTILRRLLGLRWRRTEKRKP